jgi:hypothetical protein
MEKLPENSELEELKNYARDTRILIVTLISKFVIELGIDEKHYFSDEEREDVDFIPPDTDYFSAIDNLKEVAWQIEQFENDEHYDPINYISSIYERESWIIKQLYSGLQAMGLTIRSDLYRYNEKVYAVAKEFGELYKRLHTLQKMGEIFKRSFEKNEKDETNYEINEGSKLVRELRMTILKFKWAMLFVIGTTLISSTCHFYHAAKFKKKLVAQNTELKQKLEEEQEENLKMKRLLDLCSGHSNDNNRYPQIKPQD